MSFGFSIGDFITTIKLANELRCRFIEAPGQWKAVAEDVKSLAIALQELDVVLPRRDLTPAQEDGLDRLHKACEKLLIELRTTLDENQVAIPTKTKRSILKVAWLRAQWDQKEIDVLRNRLIQILTGFQTFLQLVTSDTIFEIKSGVDKIHEFYDAHQKDSRRNAILQWLSSIDHESEQRDMIAKRQIGTGVWLLKSAEFQGWLRESGSTMLCQGIPGAGKTILTSIVISHLQEKFRNDDNSAVIYIYFTYQPKQEQVLQDLLGCLLKQLVTNLSAVPDDIEKLFNIHRGGEEQLSVKDLKAALHETIKLFSKVFIMLDALDEYHASDPVGLKNFLHEIFELQSIFSFNLFTTSRYISEITSQHYVSHSTPAEFENCICKDIRAHDEDVLAYINARMFDIRFNISTGSDIQESIRKEVLKATDGMFLLARLHMDSLMGQPTVGDVKEALKNLPKGSRGLDETYDNAMQRIDDQQPKNRHLARKILAWVVYARTALSRWEIRDALAVRPNTAHLDNDFRPELEVIDSLCAGLIAVDDNSDVVRLVHYTTQEYFTQKNFFPDAHTALAEACITYLTFDDFATGPYLHQGAFQERFREHRLYEYAAMHWSSHYIEQDQSYRKDARSVLNFLEDDTKVSASFQVNLYYNEIDTFDRRLEVQGVHLAAFMGLRDLLVTLIKAGKSPISQDNKGRTPLWFAAWNGKADIVQLLLSVYNIGSTTVGSEYNRALALAAERGHTAVVKLLLRRKDFEPAVLVYLDFHGGKYIEKTTQPLLEAVEGGHLETVQALLEDYRVDPNVENEKYKTALHISIEGDHSPVSRLLLDDSRFNPWVRDNDGRYPLLLAAMYCQFDTFQYLLNDEQTTKIGLDSIDTHIEDNNGRTLLWWASYGGDLNIVNLLLSKCTVDANRQDYDGRTPVAEAARSGSTQVLEVLLSKCKGNPNIADDTGREPLSIAAVEGHLDAVSLLITNYGVNPDAQDNSGRTALSYVAEKGKAQVADYLLGHGVNPDSKDALNRTPLSYAVNKGHVEIVEKLLENRADANAKDSNGMTILKYAWRNREVLEPLLMRGHAKPDEFTLDILDDEFGRQSEVYKFVKAKMDAIRDTEVGATDSEASTLAQDDGSVNINIVNMSLN